MESGKVDMFLMTKGNCFPAQQLPFFRDKLLAIDDSYWNEFSVLQYKNPMIALLVSVAAGCYGADRFYIGQNGLGCAKLITTIIFIALAISAQFCNEDNWIVLIPMLLLMFVFIFWYFIDIFLISKTTKEINSHKLLTFLNQVNYGPAKS